MLRHGREALATQPLCRLVRLDMLRACAMEGHAALVESARVIEGLRHTEEAEELAGATRIANS